MQPIINFIGHVRSQLKSLDDCPRQANEGAPEAILEILPAYQQGITNIQAGDKLVLLTWLHMADREVLATHPRNDTSLPVTGVFSTRSPDRPNPIGLHTVTVTSVYDNRLIKVAGLEVLDGTPVVDIKPVWKD